MATSAALAAFVKTIKDTDKAERSISNTLAKIIDDYCLSDKFDAWYRKKGRRAARRYLPDPAPAPRPGRFRASAAGKCLQAQCFAVLQNEGFTIDTDPVNRRAPTFRALHNGTIGHLRWHLFFDALHDARLVKTICAEELRQVESWSLAGSCDRVIEFEFGGRKIRAVIDFKTIKSRAFGELVAPKPEHAAQQHAYGRMHDSDAWIMLYENKDTHELKIYDRPYLQDTFAQLERDYALAAEWLRVAESGLAPLPTLPLITDWCATCEYRTACLQLNPGRDRRGASRAT